MYLLENEVKVERRQFVQPERPCISTINAIPDPPFFENSQIPNKTSLKTLLEGPQNPIDLSE